MPHRKNGLVRWLLLVIAIGLLSACSRHEGSSSAPQAKDEQVFTVRGVIRSAYQEGTISIQHEEIPNYMRAMTMPFNVDAADVRDLAPGDRVEFQLHVGKNDEARATKFRKL